MVRAGDVPLDRAHAHARWAERYDAQGEPQRSMAHFGRAVHYAQVAQAFGARRRYSVEADSREADSGHIVVGRWEDGAEAWYTVNGAIVKRRQPEPSWPGDDTSSDAGPRSPQRPRRSTKLPVYRELVEMIGELYKSESSGITDIVHDGNSGHLSIYRCSKTGRVYLVPTRLLATDRNLLHDDYKRVLKNGLLIVQDHRPGCVRVKRAGSWEHATEIETFAFYDFLLRQPLAAHVYIGAKPASEMLSLKNIARDSHMALLSGATPIPAHLQDEDSEGMALTLTHGPSGIHVFYDGDKSNRSQISDWAWRLPS